MSQNDKRAEWAKQTIEKFQEITGTEDEDAMSDLLCDMMHLADRQGPAFAVDLTRAYGHYQYEIEEES